MKQTSKDGDKFIIRLEKGEEIIESLIQFCTKNEIDSAYFHGLGAVENATISFYKLNQKEYVHREFNEPMEISNLLGNISKLDNKLIIHAHIVLAREDFSTVSGHLGRAVTSATCEIILTKLNAKLSRKFDEKIGLNLLDFPK